MRDLGCFFGALKWEMGVGENRFWGALGINEKNQMISGHQITFRQQMELSIEFYQPLLVSKIKV